MSKVEDKAVEVIDKTMQASEKVASMMTELAKQYTPDVIQATETVVRINGAQDLIIALVLAIIGIAGWKFGVFLCRNDKEWRGDGGFIFAGIISCAAGTIDAIISAVKLLNIWTWVALFSPKLWLAHAVIEKVMQ